MHSQTVPGPFQLAIGKDWRVKDAAVRGTLTSVLRESLRVGPAGGDFLCYASDNVLEEACNGRYA